MLGLFDSGIGGLTIQRAINERLLDLSTVYFGDNARAPYGTRSQEEIFQFTLEGVRFLFEKGCPLVILACNTATAGALRRIQQEILPVEFPERRVLGIIKPTVEALVDLPPGSIVGVFATPATVASHAYSIELNHLRTDIVCREIACPGLVDLIEAGRGGAGGLVKSFVDELLAQKPHPDAVLLGCTHFPLLRDVFARHLPPDTRIIEQGQIVADALAAYLDRHPEMAARIDRKGERQFFTSGDASGWLDNPSNP